MPISERMLRKWRGEALRVVDQINASGDKTFTTGKVKEDNRRILALTQELLDQALLRKETKDA